MQPKRCCGTCRFFRGDYEQCECPDWATARRALRRSDDGQWCKHHEGERE